MSSRCLGRKPTRDGSNTRWRKFQQRDWRKSLVKIVTVLVPLGCGILPAVDLAGEVVANGIPIQTVETPFQPAIINETVTFQGVKFNDLNGNGVREPDEKGISFETIFIRNDDLVSKGLPGDYMATTDIQGQYSIDGLSPGNYTVRTVVGKTLWQTAPVKATKVGNVVPYQLNVPNGTVTQEINFGIWDGVERQECTLCVVANDQQVDAGEAVSVGGSVLDKAPDGSDLTVIVEAFGFSTVKVIPTEQRVAGGNIPATLSVSFPKGGNYPVTITVKKGYQVVTEATGNIVVRDVATSDACDIGVSSIWSTRSGKWDDPTVWTGGQVPQPSDWVMIRSNHEVKLPAVTTAQMMNKEMLKVKGLCIEKNAKLGHFYYKELTNKQLLGLTHNYSTRKVRRSDACDIPITKKAKKLDPPGWWDNANTWRPSGVPGSTDSVEIPGNVTVIIPYSTTINVNPVDSLCIRKGAVLKSPTELPPDNQQYWLAINVNNLSNRGTIISSDGVSGGPGVGIYIGMPNDLDNIGTIQSGNGGDAGNGGPIRIDANNVTNKGEIKVGDGGQCNAHMKWCKKSGNGGNLTINGTGEVNINGTIQGGSGGSAGSVGIGSASVITINGNPANIKEGAVTQGQKGIFYLDPIQLKLESNINIHSGDIYFVSDENGQIEVGNLSEGAITAERTLTWAIGSGGVIDFSQVSDKAFKAGEEVIIHADNILLPAGKTLEQLVDAPKLTVGPAKLLARAAWFTHNETILGKPEETILLPLILNNLGPATDTYNLTMTTEQNWSLCKLPETVTVNSQRWVELECKVVLPSIDNAENLLTITATSQSDPTLRISSQFRLKVQAEQDELQLLPAACLLYGVQDQALNDSIFFSYDPNENIVKQLGEQCAGCDIESLAIHPLTNEIYVGSGDDTVGHPPGHLYKLNPITGELHSIGNTGFTGISSLAFDSQGRLWSWAKGQGLATLNPNTAQGQLELPSSLELADLTWDITQQVLYGVVGKELWSYAPTTGEINPICDNLPTKTEALQVLPSQFLPEGFLLLGSHQNQQLKLQVFDRVSCQRITNQDIVIGYDDVEGLAMPMAACMP